MRVRLPTETDQLLKEVEDLPFRRSVPCRPFGGFVLNFNAITNAHLDPKDLLGCFLVPFGEYEGGEVALMDLGIVFEMMNCDTLWFISKEFEHINLNYKGLRGSFVFQTDAALRDWSIKKNGLSRGRRTKL